MFDTEDDIRFSRDHVFVYSDPEEVSRSFVDIAMIGTRFQPCCVKWNASRPDVEPVRRRRGDGKHK